MKNTRPRLGSRGALFVALLVFAALPLGSRPARAADTRYQVVVNDANPIGKLTYDQLSELFLKRTQSWTDGRPARPVDLPATAPARETFSEEVLGRQVGAIKSYWQQMIFSGKAAPPPEVSSEDDVLRFVSENPGGVGYVALGTSVRPGVKVIAVMP